MVSMISEGVKVSVETFYQQDYSNPVLHEFNFAYRVTIENHNRFPVQVHSRKWDIFEADGQRRHVEGDGLVGTEPIINSGEEYQYVSGASLRTEMGAMHGSYQVENMDTKERFDVSIPVFELVAPFKYN